MRDIEAKITMTTEQQRPEAYPYFKIAQQLNVDYGTVLAVVERLEAGSSVSAGTMGEYEFYALICAAYNKERARRRTELGI